MRKLIAIALCLIVVIITYNIIHQHVTSHPLSKETIKDLFGKEIACRLISRHDLGGVDMQGGMFIFYEYEVSMEELAPLIKQNKLKGYPTFNSGCFENVKLVDSNYAVKWKHMPIHNRIDSLIFQSTFLFLEVESLKIDGTAMKNKNLLDPNNFYSCISALPIGNYFFILTPRTSRLYVVNKNG